MARDGALPATGITPLDSDPFNDPKNPKILTFHPTMEQFKEFEKYVLFMETRNAHLGGIAKIVPPREWKPRKTGCYTDVDNIRIEGPIMQDIRQTSHRGAYDVRNQEVESMTVRELRRFALEKNLVYSFAEEMDEIERNFWKQLSVNPPIYGADSAGTLFDEDCTVWNIADLHSVLRTITEEYGIAIKGVNTPYLYFGMWRAFFGWHTEDMDLYSINYIHDGAAKFWYAIPPKEGRRFERLAASLFPSDHKQCHSFLRHKSKLISHTVLRSSGIPFDRVMQHENEIIITFPYAYHAGFNCGLNVAESTNFATERWIEYGKYAAMCKCQEDNVKIDMGIFVAKYQPDRVDAWYGGTERGSHPEDERTATKRPPTTGPSSVTKLPATPSNKKSKSGSGSKTGRRKTSPSKSSSVSPRKKSTASPDTLSSNSSEKSVWPTKRASSDLSEPDSGMQASPSSSTTIIRSVNAGKRSCVGLKKDITPCRPSTAAASYKPPPGTPIMTIIPTYTSSVVKKECAPETAKSSESSQTKHLARTTDRLSTLLRQRSDSSSSASSSTSHRQLSPPSIKKDPLLCPSTLDSPPSSSDFCMSVSERVLLGRRKATIKAEPEARNTLEAVPKVKSEPRSIRQMTESSVCDEGPVDLSTGPRTTSPTPRTVRDQAGIPLIFSNQWFQMYGDIRRQQEAVSTSSSSSSSPVTDSHRFSHKGKKERPNATKSGLHLI